MTTLFLPQEKSNSLDRKSLMRTLKHCEKMLKCSFPQLMASSGVQVGKASVFYKRLAARNLTML